MTTYILYAHPSSILFFLFLWYFGLRHWLKTWGRVDREDYSLEEKWKLFKKVFIIGMALAFNFVILMTGFGFSSFLIEIVCRGLLSAVAAFTYTDIVFLVPAMLYGLLTARGKKGIVQTDPNLKTTTPKSQPEQVLEEETLEEKVESSRYEGLRRRSSP